jgi:hypothetical protein
MKTRPLFALAAALASLSLGAAAQTSTPAPVGVTPQTAEKANEKAIQRNDTGTVVRTGPTITDRAATSPAPAASAAVAPRPAATATTPARAPRADRG